MVWLVYCEIGSWGGVVYVDVCVVYNCWEECMLGVVIKLGKGSNLWIEYYLVVMVEVLDDDDFVIQLNCGFIIILVQVDIVYIIGEVGSYCVCVIIEYIVVNFDVVGCVWLVLVIDCMSLVVGFEVQYQDFLVVMLQVGVCLVILEQVLQEL